MEIFRHSSIVVESEFVKRYYASFFLLSKLSRSERLFTDFITENMDEENYVSNNARTRDRFNNLIKKIGLPEYSKSTIHKCFSSLAKHHLIFSIKGKRGLYQVNPLFFFKGSEEDRMVLIRMKLEEINREPINKHRHNLLSKGIGKL